jgi:cytochrome c556
VQHKPESPWYCGKIRQHDRLLELHKESYMRVIGVFLLAGLAMAQAPTYEPIANTQQLMQGMIDPASKAIVEAAKDPGPADNRGWRTAMLNGIMLQESAQLIKLGSRAKDQDGWMKACQALGDAGAAVQKAAAAKDVAAFQAAAGSINATCQGCHSVYRQRGGGKKQDPPKQ